MDKDTLRPVLEAFGVCSPADSKKENGTVLSLWVAQTTKSEYDQARREDPEFAKKLKALVEAALLLHKQRMSSRSDEEKAG
jgi:hypothetical protein